MNAPKLRIALSIFFATLLSLQTAHAQFSQQGPKLVGAGSVGISIQGDSVSLSADGDTAIVGGSQDDSRNGAAWVFARSGGVWTEQGAKLFGTGSAGSAQQGYAVALSADGNTAIVGGAGDNSGAGASWIYTRSGGAWIQQGGKLVATDAIGPAQQGSSVALSADGNTALVGGYFDNSQVGAAWAYTRSGGVWTQQGAKLIASDSAGTAQQGFSVSLSADGNTAIVGGYADNSGAGAAWIYTRSGGVWTQQGAKLVASDTAGNALQGASVFLSADGDTAIVGGFNDDSGVGAAWVYTRNGAVWTQQGLKLIGTGAVDNARQGRSVALSADGNIALMGGYLDNASAGAAWVYTRSAGVWTQQGAKLVGTGGIDAQQGWSVALSGDGHTAMVGGLNDNSAVGAAWVYATPGTPPPIMISAVSRKTHGAAGTFDLPLSLVATNPSTEPRIGPAQTIVMTFDKAITGADAAVIEGTATAAPPTFSGNDVVIALTGVSDQQYVSIALSNVVSADGGSGGSGSVRIGFLLGDVNQNRVVTVADLGLVNAQLAQVVTAANFLKDVNASGTLSVADKGLTNANLTKALPAP